MSNIKKIMVPFDFSESSIHALDYALNFVGPNNLIEVIALNIRVSPVDEGVSKNLNESFQKTLNSLNRSTAVDPIFIAVSGNLIESILKIQLEQNIDLIMMGTMGDRSSEESITNTSNLVLEANCAVVSIPYGCEVNIPSNIALVLGKEEIDDTHVLEVLLDIARTFDSRVHVLTIYSDSIYAEEKISETTEKTLEYYLEHFYSEHAFSKNEDIEKGIFDYVEEKDIDLLTILPRNHVQKEKASEGRLTKLLTLHSKVPLLTLD